MHPLQCSPPCYTHFTHPFHTTTTLTPPPPHRPPPPPPPPPQDCDTQLQRALNYENFDAAANIRARRQKVDEALAALQEGKGQGSKSRQAEMTDLAAEGLRVRSELQKAVEEER